VPAHPHHHPEDPAVAADVYEITDAPTSQTDDIGIRYRKYVVSMLIRTACFLLFVFIQHWTRWIFVAGAVFLPYIAVVLANAGRESKGPPPEAFSVPDLPVRQLPAITATISDIRPGPSEKVRPPVS